VLKIAATAELVELTVLRVGWVQLPRVRLVAVVT
jgi:hypothetical protein